MSLVKLLDKYDLQKEFKSMDRDYYSLDGYQAILDLFEECGNGNTDLDVVAICCDFNEEEPDDIIEEYKNLSRIADCKDDDGYIWKNQLIDALNYYTLAVELDNGNILYQCF